MSIPKENFSSVNFLSFVSFLRANNGSEVEVWLEEARETASQHKKTPCLLKDTVIINNFKPAV